MKNIKKYWKIVKENKKVSIAVVVIIIIGINWIF
tara:strand:+ start:207 stop:308 length:102 start_codon:yes stop_codon:yes gene_type:complete